MDSSLQPLPSKAFTPLDVRALSGVRLEGILEQKRRELLDLHRQLGESRKAFRRERAEQEARTAEAARKLALFRDEIEQREAQTEADRYRLRQLRRRLLLRYKRRQAAEERRLSKVAESLALERDQIQADRIALHADRERIREAYTSALTELLAGRADLARRQTALREDAHRQQDGQQQREQELAGDLTNLEQRLVENEQCMEQAQLLLVQERVGLREESAKLLQGQADLADREAAFRESQSRVEAELSSRDVQTRRQEESLRSQVEQLRQRRRQELGELQLEHSRCQALRQRWLASLARAEEQFTIIHTREREFAEQSALLEKSRQELLASVPDRATAAKRIERYERRALKASAKIDSLLAAQRTELANERERVEELLRTIEDRIEELAAHRREVTGEIGPEASGLSRRLSA